MAHEWFLLRIITYFLKFTTQNKKKNEMKIVLHNMTFELFIQRLKYIIIFKCSECVYFINIEIDDQMINYLQK